jgi:hypothetical protein
VTAVVEADSLLHQVVNDVVLILAVFSGVCAVALAIGIASLIVDRRPGRPPVVGRGGEDEPQREMGGRHHTDPEGEPW